MEVIGAKEFLVHQLILHINCGMITPPPSHASNTAQPTSSPGDHNIHLFSNNFLSIYYNSGTTLIIKDISVSETETKHCSFGVYI